MKFFSKKQDDTFFLVDEEFENTQNSDSESEVKFKAPHVLTPEEVLGTQEKSSERYDSTNALEHLKKRLSAVAAGENFEDTAPEKTEEQSPKEDMPEQKADRIETKKPSLLDNVMPYILDEDGKEAINSEPLYKLQSVADILKSDSEKTLERLSEKYDISFDDLGHNMYLSPEIAEEPEQTPEKEIFEEKLPIKKEIKNIQSNIPFVISDIDVPSETEAKPEEKDISQTATVTFTPVSSSTPSGSRISVSTKTQPIDLTGEIVSLPDTVSDNKDDELRLEEDAFDEYIPKEEYTDEKSGAKLLRKFHINKRNAFLTAVFSVFLTLLLSFARLPFMTGVLLAHTTVSMIICSAVAGLNILINFKMFGAIPKIFSRSSRPDTAAALASVLTVPYAVLSIINSEIFLDMLILLSVILSFRALGTFWKAAYMLTDLKHITSTAPKRALKLISDPAITFSMAKNAVEGDILIAADQRAEHIGSFMKYSTFGEFFGGKFPLITIFSLILGAIVGIGCGIYFDSVAQGFYAAASIQCFTALPCVFFIDALPLYSASKRLTKVGAMISGKAAAEQIEMANAAVLTSQQLFPSGTVTLHQMKVLSENNLEDTIIRAASLTEAMDSPLAPIFKKIAGTGNVAVLPDSDTVKYEDRMGISGWVDNRLLFIGNRTLMEAHSIEVPSVEVDRKILRQGYFPVYVATRDKACALLMIQYSVNPEISHELRKLTGVGVTVLVSSTDPNLTEEMICDYLGLYTDSVKVMSAAGCHMYKNTVSPVKSTDAPAVYKGNPLALPAILNCAGKFKKSNILLSAAYIICAVMATVLFAYSSFGGSGSPVSDTVLLLYCLITTVITYLLYLTERP